MDIQKKGEYLAPEVEVMEIELARVLCESVDPDPWD